MMMRLNRQGGLGVTGNVEGGFTIGALGLQENPEATPNLYVGTVNTTALSPYVCTPPYHLYPVNIHLTH